MKIPFGDLSRQYKEYKNEFDSIITSVLEKETLYLEKTWLNLKEILQVILE